MKLSDLPLHSAAIVVDVADLGADDRVGRRLRELGFVADEPVKVVAKGPFGAEPLLIQIGFTRFALRRAEADRVQVRTA
ncbi:MULTISPECIES: ferrous iron transport protein A [Asticcacaulis]|jgi:ferrous iron transport protein A|uniref:FeoA family protein n=2 Tax=Asticcacaulis TaxID=76890 RepID=E8RKR6_ASTEC|nr:MULTISPECIES: FeoA family protein [Asticcacaulis]ADU13600.1 FeoA family protein [Asticcacaulis excentricus CB 48]MDC7695826.1 FeoA family protein [Asticcacaulis currens]BEV11270.1 ferrous iron transport protein A [Asticcacaulis sp. DW145]